MIRSWYKELLYDTKYNARIVCNSASSKKKGMHIHHPLICSPPSKAVRWRFHSIRPPPRKGETPGAKPACRPSGTAKDEGCGASSTAAEVWFEQEYSVTSTGAWLLSLEQSAFSLTSPKKKNPPTDHPACYSSYYRAVNVKPGQAWFSAVSHGTASSHVIHCWCVAWHFHPEPSLPAAAPPRHILSTKKRESRLKLCNNFSSIYSCKERQYEYKYSYDYSSIAVCFICLSVLL